MRAQTRRPAVTISLAALCLLAADGPAARRELKSLLAAPGLHPTVHEHLVDLLGQRL